MITEGIAGPVYLASHRKRRKRSFANPFARPWSRWVLRRNGVRSGVPL